MKNDTGYAKQLHAALQRSLKGDHAAAVSSLKAVSLKWPEKSGPLVAIGQILYFELAEPEQAIPWLERALTIKPDHELASILTYYCYFDLDRTEEALGEVRRFLRTGKQLNRYKDIVAAMVEEGVLTAEEAADSLA